jgi:tRNA (adenine37-N6)-methyltransferase
MTEAAAITVRPIGIIRNAQTEWTDVVWEDVVSQVVLEDRWRGALEGLDGFSHIWVICWLSRVPEEDRGARLTVQPRGVEDLPPVGLFATRSPRRPNPIALTAVPLLSVDGPVLTVRGLDMLDGTPVLDIKPYLDRGDRISRTRSPRWIRRLWRDKPWLAATQAPREDG